MIPLSQVGKTQMERHFAPIYKGSEAVAFLFEPIEPVKLNPLSLTNYQRRTIMNQKWKTYGAILTAGVTALTLAGCGDNKEAPKAESQQSGLATFKAPKIDTKGMLAKAKDGTFTGQSKPNDRGGYTELTITIENHKITAAKFVGYNKDGSIKGEDYGKTNGKIENKVYYNKAQMALQANTSYAEALLQKQEVNKVDGISGATDSYILFFDASQKALEAAERG